MFNLVTISNCEILADVHLALCIICQSLQGEATQQLPRTSAHSCVFLIDSF